MDEPIRHVGKVLMTKLFIYLLTCAFVEFVKGCCATVDVDASVPVAVAALLKLPLSADCSISLQDIVPACRSMDCMHVLRSVLI